MQVDFGSLLLLLLLLVTLVIPGSEMVGVCGTVDQEGPKKGVRGGGGAKGKSQQETKKYAQSHNGQCCG